MNTHQVGEASSLTGGQLQRLPELLGRVRCGRGPNCLISSSGPPSALKRRYFDERAQTQGAYLVQVVAVRPCEQYVTENILDPLGMDNTALEQVLSPELAANVSMGYSRWGSPVADGNGRVHPERGESGPSSPRHRSCSSRLAAPRPGTACSRSPRSRAPRPQSHLCGQSASRACSARTQPAPSGGRLGGWPAPPWFGGAIARSPVHRPRVHMTSKENENFSRIEFLTFLRTWAILLKVSRAT
jgi:CubicO group peptidase (beta-lactamase class C family)